MRAVAARIAIIRRTQGFTQEMAAERYGTALKNWQRFEAGQNLTLRTLARVAEALDVGPAELLGAGAAADVLLAADSAKGTRWQQPHQRRRAKSRRKGKRERV